MKIFLLILIIYITAASAIDLRSDEKIHLKYAIRDYDNFVLGDSITVYYKSFKILGLSHAHNIDKNSLLKLMKAIDSIGSDVYVSYIKKTGLKIKSINEYNDVNLIV